MAHYVIRRKADGMFLQDDVDTWCKDLDKAFVYNNRELDPKAGEKIVRVYITLDKPKK